LFPDRVNAIVPPSTASREEEYGREVLNALPALGPWVRGVLVGLAVAVTAVFGLAAWLDPYVREQGKVTARRMETHRQLGLPPCTFFALTGKPCPSCGMTTSFALLMHGDVVNSVRANVVGTLLALCGLLFIPWAVVSAVKGRTLFVRSLEATVTITVLIFLGLMIVRWGIIVLFGLEPGRF
jgi:hypothetical protein